MIAKMLERPTHRRYRLAVAVFLGLSGAFSQGCSPGIQWRGVTFEPVHADACRDRKLTFVYFRHWAIIACTNFEENVLKSPEVLEVLRPGGAFYCAVLDAYVDRRLADEWGVEGPPGVVILDPADRVLARLSGEITGEQLLASLRRAIEAFPAASQSARGP